MGRFVEGEDGRRSLLLPDSLEDYVTEDNLVCVVEAFIDELDLGALAFESVQSAASRLLLWDHRLRSVSAKSNLRRSREAFRREMLVRCVRFPARRKVLRVDLVLRYASFRRHGECRLNHAGKTASVDIRESFCFVQTPRQFLDRRSAVAVPIRVGAHDRNVNSQVRHLGFKAPQFQ